MPFFAVDPEQLLEPARRQTREQEWKQQSRPHVTAMPRFPRRAGEVPALMPQAWISLQRFVAPFPERLPPTTRPEEQRRSETSAISWFSNRSHRVRSVCVQVGHNHQEHRQQRPIHRLLLDCTRLGGSPTLCFHPPFAPRPIARGRADFNLAERELPAGIRRRARPRVRHIG